MASNPTQWPELDFGAWQETGTALHLWSQIIGKIRLAAVPWVNHSWHATLYVTERGLTTGPFDSDGIRLTLTFDFVDHQLTLSTSEGSQAFPLEAMSVSQFYERVERMLKQAGFPFDIHGSPNEVEDPVPFAQDAQQRPYDRQAVENFHKAMINIDRVFSHFRTGFIGKVSPVHLFWGSFDLAVTRFSGREAPLHPGGIPNLPDEVTREAYSHEVSSAGFWPGGGGVDEAMFYSYAYPAGEGFSKQPVQAKEAVWNEDLGEFLLSYEAVRTADDPDAALMAFLQSTYEAAANTSDWDRASLECPLGQPGVPRPIA